MGGFTTMDLFEPSSETVSGGVVQLMDVRLVFCSKVQPGVGDGQEMRVVFVVVRRIASCGILK